MAISGIKMGCRFSKVCLLSRKNNTRYEPNHSHLWTADNQICTQINQSVKHRPSKRKWYLIIKELSSEKSKDNNSIVIQIIGVAEWTISISNSKTRWDRPQPIIKISIVYNRCSHTICLISNNRFHRIHTNMGIIISRIYNFLSVQKISIVSFYFK